MPSHTPELPDANFRPGCDLVHEVCLAQPEAVYEQKGAHASYLIRGKVFAWYLANHHNDGVWAVACKVLPGDNELLVKSDPAKFYLPAYMTHRGWVGLRLDLKTIDREEVTELIQGSYLLTTGRAAASGRSKPARRKSPGPASGTRKSG